MSNIVYGDTEFYRNNKTKVVVSVIRTRIVNKRKYIRVLAVNLESIDEGVIELTLSEFKATYSGVTGKMLKDQIIPVFNSVSSLKDVTYPVERKMLTKQVLPVYNSVAYSRMK